MKQVLLKFTDWLDKTKKDISRKDLQTVYKKARNLKQLLVKGKITQYQPTLGFFHVMQQTMQNLPQNGH